MTWRRWLIFLAVVCGLIVGGVLLWQWWLRYNETKIEKAKESAEEQENTLQLQAILKSPYEKIVFFAEDDVFVASFRDDDTAKVQEDTSAIASNLLSEEGVWYSVEDSTLARNSIDGTRVTINTISQPVMADTSGQQPPLAVDVNEQYIAWVTIADGKESIILFDLTTKEEKNLFEGEEGAQYSNLVWSPDGSEFSVLVDNEQVITLTQAGAQLYNPIRLPFMNLQSLTWVDSDTFGAVATSSDLNPKPFSPKIVVFDRFGTVTEEHNVLNKVGVPKLLWSPDGTEFLFLDPWRNIFLIYDRFDQLQLTLRVNASGKLEPFGWISGEQRYRTPAATTSATTTTTNTNTAGGTEFIVTAEEWDRYNATIRSILRQFEVDSDTYRFATTEKGFDIALSFFPGQKRAEMAALQTLLQIFAVLPDVPTVTIRAMIPPKDTLLILESVTLDEAEALVERFTDVGLDGLFVINAENPTGKRATKPAQRQYHYIGDLVYSNFGDYNPYSALAMLDATLGDNSFYDDGAISFLYPSNWSVKEIDESTTLLFTGETTFASQTAWSGFGVTVKRYRAPDVSFEQWLSVNRPDQTLEESTFTRHQPLVARHVVPQNTYSDEFILSAEGNVYVVRVERDAGLTGDDTTIIQAIVESFTDHNAFQRN